MSELAAKMSGLNPFSRSSKGKSKRPQEDEEDLGEEIDDSTVAGGGHGSHHPADTTKGQLRVSHALRSFLAHHGILSETDAGLEEEDAASATSDALRHLLEKPHVVVPPSVTDRSRPLPEYFISSSHNTYLLAHQLFGASCATAYRTALKTGSRCVEIDAWDNDDDDNKAEPKVTHGYTLVSNIPFRLVCETIRDVVDEEAAEAAAASPDTLRRPAPILISLENHCNAAGQLRLVQIMKEVFGDRLLNKAVREKGHDEQAGSGEHVLLEELGSKVVVIVEYHFPNEADSSDSSSSSSDDEEEQRKARQEYEQKKQAAPSTVIIPELAELGVYAQSVKPQNNDWFEVVDANASSPPPSTPLPHHHLINVSESGLSSHLPASAAKIAAHNGHHLMRVFPKGTRISSRNLRPVPYWSVGAQICALNWQTFGAAMQLNEALFCGTDGFVLKPPALRPNTTGMDLSQNIRRRHRKLLRIHVAGASSLPLPSDREAGDIKPYLTATLLPGSGEPVKRKTSPYRQHRLGFLHRGENPPTTDPVWDETLDFGEFDDTEEMAFVRLLVKSDDSFARNPVFAVAAVRLLYVVGGSWAFVGMMDLKGHETGCSLLVRFEVEDV